MEDFTITKKEWSGFFHAAIQFNSLPEEKAVGIIAVMDEELNEHLKTRTTEEVIDAFNRHQAKETAEGLDRVRWLMLDLKEKGIIKVIDEDKAEQSQPCSIEDTPDHRSPDCSTYSPV